MITGNKEFPLGRESPEPSYEVIILSTLQVILYGISGTDDNIRILRHLQAAMVAMGVGECDDDFIIKRYHKTGSL